MGRHAIDIVADAQSYLAQGRAMDFVALLSSDIKFTVRGTTRVSGVFESAQSILEWFSSIGARLASAVVRPGLVLTDGDWVITSDHVEAITITGAVYKNDYLRLWRCEADLIVEIIEYLDTQAVVDCLFADAPKT